jgi:hypothetical protein
MGGHEVCAKKKKKKEAFERPRRKEIMSLEAHDPPTAFLGG